MRKTLTRFLNTDDPLPRYDDLQDELLLLRGHLALIIPEVEALARTASDGPTAAASALIAAGNARARQDGGPGSGLVSAVRHARGLAHALQDLCDQYEALTTTASGEPGTTSPRRAVLRHSEWTLSPERDKHGHTLVPRREVQCETCGQRSGARPDQPSTDTWALRHAGLTHHRSYLEIVTAALNARPAPTNPLCEAEVEAEQEEQTPS